MLCAYLINEKAVKVIVRETESAKLCLSWSCVIIYTVF